ncbi:hypothetical protein [Ancylobacter terrae]|uniref:hypothetical protein n=1 Tax=Ancylobacter sp. sgz301288 TaxID=3342077 RepID=UPI00385B6AD4
MPRPLHEMPLFPTEAEISRELMGPGKSDIWSGVALALERQGFPQKDATFGRRYWPAIKQWLDHRHGVGNVEAPSGPDGEEDWSWNKPRAKRTPKA